MIRGTFCDWLMMRGVEFHPDTVIVDNTDIAEYTADLDLSPVCIPVFDICFIEAKFDSFMAGILVTKMSQKDIDVILSGDWEHKTSHKTAVSFFDTHPHSFSVQGWSSNYKEFVHEPTTFIMGYLADGSQGEALITPLNNNDAANSFRLNVLDTFELFHKKAEIELVDWPRNFRRRMKRKEGKEPSPFFRIVSPDAKDIRYQGDNPNPPTGRKMPLHIVRGHFRHVENHPIEWFNGVRWIPAHTRGNKDNGQTIKGYKIRLPETQDSA